MCPKICLAAAFAEPSCREAASRTRPCTKVQLSKDDVRRLASAGIVQAQKRATMLGWPFTPPGKDKPMDAAGSCGGKGNEMKSIEWSRTDNEEAQLDHVMGIVTSASCFAQAPAFIFSAFGELRVLPLCVLLLRFAVLLRQSPVPCALGLRMI